MKPIELEHWLISKNKNMQQYVAIIYVLVEKAIFL